MKDYIKVDFKDDDLFIVYYITNTIYEKEEDYKNLFKYLNNYLEKKYNRGFNGYYDVNIYNNKGIYILEFDYLDSYTKNDFNVTLFLNSIILYEYEDISLIDKEKIYYKKKFYTEIENIIDDIKLFEYGNIIYGKSTEKILNNGILFN